MAVGMTDTQINQITGYSLPHLNTLRRSPAFQGLLMFFCAERDDGVGELKAKIEGIADRALDRVAEVIFDDERVEKLSSESLRRITTDLLDRCGHSPVQKVASVSVGMTLQEIREMKAALRQPAMAAE